MKVAFRHPYDFVCGIGHYCATATYLKRHFLRAASGPLDWIGESPEGLRKSVELIATDFKDFLRECNLVLLDHPAGAHDDLENDYYRDTATGMLVYHEFAAGEPLSETFPAVRSKYDRRIARFYRLAQSGRTLLVFQTYTSHPAEVDLLEAIRRLRERLGEQTDLLVIESIANQEQPTFEELEAGLYLARGNFHRPEIHWLIGDYPILDRVYSAIPYRGKLRLRFRKAFGKIVSSFHFSKEARHRARAKFQG